MMSKIRAIPPFETPEYDSVALDPISGWEISKDGGQTFSTISDKGLFPSWDSALEFILRRRFRLSSSELAKATGLTGANPRFSLVTRLTTCSGRLSMFAPLQEVLDYREDHEVVLRPDSALLSQNIVLKSSIVLTGFTGMLGALAPDFKGAVLWTDDWSVKLESGRQRLPADVVPFSTFFHDGPCGHAIIRVVVVEDPQLDFNQAVRVYINQEMPQFVTAFSGGNPVARTFFNETVFRQLVSYGLSEAFIGHDMDLSEDSVGKKLSLLVRQAFGNDSTEMIREMKKQNPGLYEARIQSKALTGSTLLQAGAL
jgi:hypothetical protein